jgi:hypothetical protein
MSNCVFNRKAGECELKDELRSNYSSNLPPDSDVHLYMKSGAASSVPMIFRGFGFALLSLFVASSRV